MSSLQSEIRSLVSLGDSAAGGGASGGEHSKRPSSRGASSSVTVSTKKKKSVTQTALVGPVLFDSSVEWWGGEKVNCLNWISYPLLCLLTGSCYCHGVGSSVFSSLCNFEFTIFEIKQVCIVY